MGGGARPALRLVSPEPRPKAPPGSSDEFYTPSRWYLPWHQEFRFTLDVCATTESAKCPRFFTKAEDGLAQSWAGERVWCNPPYSDITPWVRKALWETVPGRFERRRPAELVAALLPCWTDRAWWHQYIEPWRSSGEVEVRFIPGRIRFGWPGNPEGAGARGGGRFPSALVLWRPGRTHTQVSGWLRPGRARKASTLVVV